MRFRDRADAGRRLTTLLLRYSGSDTRVFGMNGGGVRVAYEVAQALGSPLELWVSRAVEVPGQPGSRLGAMAEGEGFCLNPEMVRSVDAPASEMTRWMDAQAGEGALEAQRLRGTHPRLGAGAGTALLVVDGIALGEPQACAALRGLRRQSPQRLVLAAPVAAAEELERLRLEADEVLCLQPVWSLLTVEHGYDDFRPLPELEIRQLLERSRELRPGLEAPVPGAPGEWM